MAPPMGIPRGRNQFWAATWNVYHGTDPDTIENLLSKQLDRGVSIFLFQEISKIGVRDVIRSKGLRLIYQDPQYGVAYRPQTWTTVAAGGIRLSDTPWFSKGSDEPRYSDGAWVILGDSRGRTLTALSYHLPPHVQVADPPARRIKAARESMETLRRLARNAKTNACLFGGDDNVDEARRFKDRFRFMTRKPLVQVRAPAPTHGRRRIDDFRITGLEPLEGKVSPGGGDHRIHARQFRWA